MAEQFISKGRNIFAGCLLAGSSIQCVYHGAIVGAGAKRRVLLVDDELSVCMMLQAVLESGDYAVVTACSAADARNRLTAEDFDVVITDMRMETAIAGYDVVRAARRKSPRPAIIILTAFPIGESHWRSEGADAGMTKPVPISELLGTIDQLLARRAKAG